MRLEIGPKGKTWQQTMHLRTLRRTVFPPGFNPETDATRYEYVLQQKWTCLDDGSERWDDIPTVYE